MKKLTITSLFAIFCLTSTFAQVKVKEDGRLNLVYNAAANGVNEALYLGSFIHPNHPDINNGRYTIEILNSGILNICRDWPSPGWRNFLFCIEPDRDYNVGIGRRPSTVYKLDVEGDIASYGLKISSDKRLKTNILPVSEERDRIYKLEGKSYTKTFRGVDDSEISRLKGVPESAVSNRKLENKSSFEYGFIAQELKEIYPELVTQDQDGYYAINYIGLIPLMVEALKEQKKEIEELKNVSAISLKNAIPQESGVFSLNEADNQAASLEQNIPNPFNQNTAIKYYLPETVATAYLCFYDLQGKQLKQITLSGRGESSQTILGSQFSPGIYLYALIADGQEVDVKRMILTE